jgi:hypothetical protein
VLLEALASSLPVAANPVVGPLDVIGDSGAGELRSLRSGNGLDIWFRRKKVLNIERSDEGAPEIISYKPGELEARLFGAPLD